MAPELILFCCIDIHIKVSPEKGAKIYTQNTQTTQFYTCEREYKKYT